MDFLIHDHFGADNVPHVHVFSGESRSRAAEAVVSLEERPRLLRAGPKADGKAALAFVSEPARLKEFTRLWAEHSRKGW